MKTTVTTMRTYSELVRIPSFKERFEYLAIGGKPGAPTFGSRRYLNQRLYHSSEWYAFRNKIILRDSLTFDYPLDLAHPDYPIIGRVIIHHLNPLAPDEIEHMADSLFDPENVVTVSERVHNAIHFGDSNLIPKGYTPRTQYDTCPWKLSRGG